MSNNLQIKFKNTDIDSDPVIGPFVSYLELINRRKATDGPEFTIYYPLPNDFTDHGQTVNGTIDMLTTVDASGGWVKNLPLFFKFAKSKQTDIIPAGVRGADGVKTFLSAADSPSRFLYNLANTEVAFGTAWMDGVYLDMPSLQILKDDPVGYTMITIDDRRALNSDPEWSD